MTTNGHVALWSILAVGLFDSIMFPNIFLLGLWNLGALTSSGASLMVAAIVGGATVPVREGRIADSIEIQQAFIIPLFCYLLIAFFRYASKNRMAAAAAFTDPI